MLFNSIVFLVFALLFFVGWPFMRKKNTTKWLFLTGASLVFYGWWDWRFLSLIIFSGLLDYFAALGMPGASAGKKRFLLVVSLIGNLGSLFIFKYSSFVAALLDSAFASFGMTTDLQGNLPEFTLILPMGISFYTFQSMSYTIDIYRDRLQPTRNILHFFSYLTMFPQLVAGPIVRAKDILKQLAQDRQVSVQAKWHAIKLFVYGLFQKTVIADNLSFFIDSAFEGKSTYDGPLFWWAVTIGFGMQIYCDFCGYSLMARGLAKYMGYHFKMNFNHPYISLSFKEFWSRWHISLSTWFRDYVYIPLGGSRSGVNRGLFYMGVTMVISGIWHGANMTFIAWGGLHAIYLAVERLINWRRFTLKLPAGKFITSAITMMLVFIAWIYFRAESVEQANTIIPKLFGTSVDFGFVKKYLNQLVYLFIAVVIELTIFIRIKKIAQLKFLDGDKMELVGLVSAVFLIWFFHGEGAQFIYFQF